MPHTHDRHTGPTTLPDRAGVGFKPQHAGPFLDSRADVGWIEVHAENYMGAGGPPHRLLGVLRERYALSIHGVGLSIGSANPLDRDHLLRLKALVERYEPDAFSEHLAWSSHGGTFFNDLLPLPYTAATLNHVVAHIDQVQDTLRRPMLLENPATYVTFVESTIPETEFLTEIARRTGCGLLLDINNVFVSATNHGYDPAGYLAAFPMAHVGEIHLAGHATDADAAGAPLLIDAHDRPVAEPVWALYRRALERIGPVPSLIEWDNDVPDWPDLAAEAARADAILGSLTDITPSAATERAHVHA